MNCYKKCKNYKLIRYKYESFNEWILRHGNEHGQFNAGAKGLLFIAYIPFLGTLGAFIWHMCYYWDRRRFKV